MFGFYRAFLAITVVLLHLYGIPRIGNYAVFTFFILSGFLMTTIMQEQYGYSTTGRIKFAINRALRLYPVYYFSIALTIVLIIIIGEDYLSVYNSHLYLPKNLNSWLYNLTMIFPNLIPHKIEPILSPATWAITVELCYYALICIGISKTQNRVIFWIGVSILYYMYAHYAKTPTWRYAAIPAGSLPFALGSWLFFVKEKLHTILKKIKLSSPLWLFILFLINPLIANAINSQDSTEICFYLNIFISLVLTCALFYQGFPFIKDKLDAILGAYSYPIYLLHYQAGAIVTFLILGVDDINSINSKNTSWLALPILLLISYFTILLVDRNITLLREKVKNKK
jgi:peptidoglycan/LPS O-acetylase OafA/YrhL